MTFLAVISAGFASDSKIAATATNELGVDLYRQLAKGDGNLCLSPFSIESALAMTLAGADGETRNEMERVLHLSKEADQSFAALNKSLQAMAGDSAKDQGETPAEAIELSIANRLFAQEGYPFRDRFLALAKENYGAPLESLDFKNDAVGATKEINDWVAKQTRERIENLIPPNALDGTTRMVLANALYLKAAWAKRFEKDATEPAPFHVRGGAPVDVPMMHQRSRAMGYAEKPDYTAISLPYVGDDLKLVVLLPNEVNSLAKIEARLSAQILEECRQLGSADINLSFPKFKIEPPTIALQSELKSLGMRSAFDDPAGSANFDRLAPRRPNNYLFISKVFHKTFLAVDENGTEAAAATAVVMARATSAFHPEEPIEVKVDRPFLYFIQQSSTGVCLFLGRVTDPR